jgi:hypothetical protein
MIHAGSNHSVHPNVLERRFHGRTAYSGTIFFATRKRIYEGLLLNYSPRGLCIRAAEKLAEGEIVVVALPFADAGPAKRKGRVVWCNGKGIGVKLVS